LHHITVAVLRRGRLTATGRRQQWATVTAARASGRPSTRSRGAPRAVKVTKGPTPAAFSKSENAIRSGAKICSGHLSPSTPSEPRRRYAEIPTLPFEAGLHVHYGETVLRMHDGKPKFNDLPTDFKGSGTLVAE
jgi:hypothetical protein